MKKVSIIYLVFVTMFAQLTIYTPDSLISYSLQYMISPLGSPGLFNLVGNTFEMSPKDCSFDSDVFNNLIPLIKKPENCSYTQLSSSAEKQGAPYIIFMTDNYEYVQDFYLDTKVGIPVLSISEDEYAKLNLRSFSSILLSYKYKVTENTDPEICVEFIGGFRNRLMYINSLFDLVNGVDYNFYNFSIKFAYKEFDELIHDSKTDCISFEERMYCDKSELSGRETLESSIISFNIYNNIPKTPESILNYLKYLHNLYSSCSASPITPCHIKILKEFQYTYNESYNTLSTFSFFSSNFSHFFFNLELFPWPSYLVQTYCLSKNSNHTNCPKCSPTCNISLYFTEYCDTSCNSSTCGYSNLLCLSYNGDPLCLNSMINDEICSMHCLYEDDCTQGNSKLNKNRKFEAVLIAMCVIIPLFLLLTILFCVKLCAKKKKQETLPETELFTSKFKYGADEIVCPIDLEVLIEGEDIVFTPCSHGFHYKCLKNWVDSQTINKKRCPVCLTPLGNIKIKLK